MGLQIGGLKVITFLDKTVFTCLSVTFLFKQLYLLQHLPSRRLSLHYVIPEFISILFQMLPFQIHNNKQDCFLLKLNF